VKPFPPLKTDSDDMLHLDALRALGAVLIVVFHFNRFINIDGRWQAVDDTVKSFSLLVDLFFVISGYVISAVYTGRIRTVSDFRWFLQKRVARLMPLHWLTLAVFIVIAIAGVLGLVNDRDPSRYDPACVVPNLLNLQAFGICRAQTFNFVSWSISAEWAMYLLLPLLFWLAMRGTAWLTLVTVVILAALFAIPAEQPFHMWTADFGVARAAPGFLVGMIAYKLRGPLGRLAGARWWFFVSCAAFVAGCADGAGAAAVRLLRRRPAGRGGRQRAREARPRGALAGAVGTAFLLGLHAPPDRPEDRPELGGAWAAAPDGRRHAPVVPLLGPGADPGQLPVADVLREAGAGCDRGLGEEA
jgi:peptidoglycan/LPS O-acetylase OafA/YrhL